MSKTVRVEIEEGEVFPIYTLSIDVTVDGDAVEIPEGVYRHYIEVEKNYLKMQEELRRLYYRGVFSRRGELNA